MTSGPYILPPKPVRGRVNAHHVKSEEEIAGEKQGKKKKSPSPVSSSTAGDPD